LANDAPNWYDTMLINSMLTASATGARVERDDMSTATSGTLSMMLEEPGETHHANRLAIAIADSFWQQCAARRIPLIQPAPRTRIVSPFRKLRSN
jgi:hypothetical protein